MTNLTQEEINKGSQLIIVFMKYKYLNTKKFWFIYRYNDNSFLRKMGYISINSCKFHQSWEWFMPALRTVLYHQTWNGEFKDKLQEIQLHVGNVDLRTAFKSMIEFIELYNETIKK